MNRTLLLLSSLAMAASWSSGCSSSTSASDAAVEAATDGSVCSPACGTARSCCGGRCVNPANDPLNCGGCGVACFGATPYCDGSGQCIARPCGVDAGTCATGTTCCGSQCCGADQICCDPQGPISMGPVCVSPSGSPPTCPGGCAPLCISDRNLKRDVVPVDEAEVLARVARMPVSRWSYVWDDPSVQHIGPMAQDFYAAFGLGRTDRAYDPIDAHGVAFAAIRALDRQLREQGARIDRLEAENARLRARRR